MIDAARHPLWWDAIAVSKNRATLDSDISTDVAIVGAGYTGLWTAYYLQQRAPELNIVIIDANTVGFGASSRNGGWCSALFPTSITKLAKDFGGLQAIAMQQALIDNLDEIERVVSVERIDCDFVRSGTIMAARNKVQVQRAKQDVVDLHRFGFAGEHLNFLMSDELLQRIKMTNMYAGTFTPHCATIQPAKLVHSLAEIVERHGATIYEHTTATSINRGMVTTTCGTISARFVIRATEGFTKSLSRNKRTLLPLYSLMIATESLPESMWNEIGLHQRETFSDYRNLLIYGQRTADNRLAFGGRGARYHFGSAIKPEFDQVGSVHAALRKTLTELFPTLEDVKITHTWGGPLGVPRDWMPSVNFDKYRGLASAGGYVGDGVSASNLAGRTLADLITKQRTPITHLPWVNHRGKPWEVEPFRWIGTNLGVAAAKRADVVEAKRNKPSKFSSLVARFTGH